MATKKLSPLTIRRLRRIQKTILLKYRQLNMEEWWLKHNGEDQTVGPGCDLAPTDKLSPVNNCKTSACLAGWGMALYPKEVTNRSFGHTAGRKILGLTAKQADRLFYDYNWPAPWYDLSAETIFDATLGTYGDYAPNPAFAPIRTKKYAKLVSARIDHFIATDGRE